METKLKDSSKTKEAIKLLQQEVRQLHALVLAQANVVPGATPIEVPVELDGNTSVQYALHYKSGDAGVRAVKERTRTVSQSLIDGTSDAAAAEVGYGLSSPQKISLLRTLLVRGTEGAAALGVASNLSTGSLYHHLRDLMHSGLVTQSARNRYELTSRGTRALLLILAISSERELGK